MAKNSKFYLAGSIICILSVGGIVYYIAKSESAGKASSSGLASAAQNQALQPVSSQDQTAAGASADNEATAEQDVPAATVTATPTTDASQQGPGGARGNMPNIPAGSKPIFGQVASVSGSTLTVTTMSRRAGGASGDSTATAADTAAPAATKMTVTLTDSTVFSGGTKDALVAGARIFGYGTANADGSITATNIQINPTRPAGGAGGGWQNHEASTSSTQQ